MKWAGFPISEEELCKLFKALHDQIQLLAYYSLPGQLDKTASTPPPPPTSHSVCVPKFYFEDTELVPVCLFQCFPPFLPQLALAQEAGLYGTGQRAPGLWPLVGSGIGSPAGNQTGGCEGRTLLPLVSSL